MVSRTRKHRADDAGRECSLCDTYKPWPDYYAGAGPYGKDTRCKECMKDKTRARNKLPEVQAVEKARWPERWREEHPGEEYAPRREGRDVVRHRALRVGLTVPQLQQLTESAVFGLGLCDLHGGPEVMKHPGGTLRSLSVDHDHTCGRHVLAKVCVFCVRGLLCCDCNRNIIRAAERHPEIAKRFLDYLERRPLLATID